MSELIRDRLAVSFIVDQDPVFAYTGWILAHSLARHAGICWPNIHVQFTPEVSEEVVEAFENLGCTPHRLSRFGDGRYCNKIAQWDTLRDVPADHFLFLDTDMVCIGDLAGFIPNTAISGKIVDLDNPRLATLELLFEKAGFSDRPPIVRAEARDSPTFRANCNGGFYSVPKKLAEPLFASWRQHALALLEDIEPLQSARKESHVDQVAFCMAIHETGLPFEHLPSNINYYLHIKGEHCLYDASSPLSLLHYHNNSLNLVGVLDPPGAIKSHERKAVDKANALIREIFNTRLFWDLRYQRFPERGSGVGSRGANLEYKRRLLREHGAEQAASILDVGSGDLEVMRSLDLSNYIGIDRSEASLALAASARPDWTFLKAPAKEAPSVEMVLCFEVAIHQETADEYYSLIRFLAEKTERTLIVSGYDEPPDKTNHMLFFYEPLRQTLQETGKFSSIQKIGAHSSVVVYRCDVNAEGL